MIRYNARNVFKQSGFELLFLVASFIYLMPPYLKTIGVFFVCYNNLLPIVSVGIIFYFAFNIKNKDVYIIICLSYLIIVFSTCLHHGDTFSILKVALNGVAYCSLAAYMFDRKNYRACIMYLIFIFEVLVTLNLVIVILFPEGLYRVYGFNMSYSNAAYLLGHRNNAIEYMIPMTGFCILRDILNRKYYSWNTIYAIAISLLTSIMTWSVNAILCIAFEAFAMILIIIKHKFKLFNIWLMFITSAAISVLLIFFRYQEHYAGLIVNIFQKDVTLSNRIFLWDKALEWIPKSPIIGFGVETQEIFYQKIGHISSCHNYFLDYLYQGGVVLLIIIVLLMKRVSKIHSSLIQEEKTRIAIAYGGYMILWIASPIHRESLFMMYSYFIITSSLCKRKGVLRHDT